ncbi:precorrin-6A/cobalt-precorrin-6A reductase [Sphingomonas sp. BE270]|jgi:precorrin-6A/cobalt-precorrin-6A reductase|nr:MULTISPECIES: cobalt-precorrin-6A reductase [unclassified Sphingomonas]MDR6848447.1 precorrin-6A/cobalt-precorrin-6A reductase [Sphingomonas sp. BE137]MDR7259109.1 precorrin-6A/cobalt-precorrin-6A reductase [Sphingomonas sp. BE270]
MRKVLLLGGTTEASALAALLAAGGVAATLSYAGRTQSPRPQPVPVRIGGFGGIGGLAGYLREHRITHLVDGTHPFAATMSTNAIAAARLAGVAHIALTRPAWVPTEEDRWSHVADIAGAVAALTVPPRRILLALGRMHVDAFVAQPQHRYLLRFVDVPDQPPPLPHYSLIVDRGPFTVDGDVAVLRDHAIDLVVCKNAGGSGAEAKLIAARRLGVPVLMIDRPAMPERHQMCDPAAVLDWLLHDTSAERGV